LIGPELI